MLFGGYLVLVATAVVSVVKEEPSCWINTAREETMQKKKRSGPRACRVILSMASVVIGALTLLSAAQAQVATPTNSTIQFVSCIEDKSLGLIVLGTSLPTGVNAGDSCGEAINELQQSGYDLENPITLKDSVYFFMKSPPICGNNILEGNETCDSSNLRGQDCVGLGFASGTLACESHCSAYDTTQCDPILPSCPDPSETYCPIDGLCVDLAVNVRNCGACGNECPIEAPNCVSGACQADP